MGNCIRQLFHFGEKKVWTLFRVFPATDEGTHTLARNRRRTLPAKEGR